MRGLTIGHISERNARRTPDRDAVRYRPPEGDPETVTFAEFDERANRVANGLRSLGLAQGDKVGVYMQNGIEVLETYVGAMKIGTLPVPVNHRFKADEVRYVLADSDARVCVFDADARDAIEQIHDSPEHDIETFLYAGGDSPGFADHYAGFRDAASAGDIDIVPTRLDEATLMYTSGTTGRPKGCILTHDNVVQNSQNSVYEAGFDEDDTFLVVTPLFHIAAFALFVNTFYVGATTVVQDDFVPPAVMETVVEEGVSGAFFVPTMSRALLGLPDFDEYDLSAFEHYMTGAAPSGEELKKTVVERFDADLYDAFGQTEMSPVTTMLMPEDVEDKPESLGRPVINVEVKVVDPDTGEEVGPGDIGRICYRGPTVFEGYYGMPERTAEVLDEDGWFHSGDLVERDEDGFIYFAGRSDDMIISGGENIYPAEIEETLYEHPASDEVAIVGVPDEKWGERVRACVVLEEGESLTEEEVTNYVGERLADYKKPREVLFLDELPRNPTGKVLKHELEEI